MSAIECVPNFSDGRDPALAAALRAAVTAVPGVKLLGWHSDPDHNRSVATFAGEPGPVMDAAFAAIACATERIDLTRHSGVHPRLGATDVCPFVPLRAGDMPVCVATARALGERVGRELDLPVYYYGEAARTDARRALPAVRRGGFEALCEAIERDPARAPDAGPARLHPRAGAIAIGARGFLVAFNVVLESRDLAVARAIARSIREANGGLAGVRALGFTLASRDRVQVSVNLCDPERTGLVAVFRAIEEAAGRHGVRVRESELVGLAPAFALDERIARAVRLPRFEPREHVLEAALASANQPGN
jgi:glutamate formiminotransferase/formiminotetrahydrofolate cyclodeaminase